MFINQQSNRNIKYPKKLVRICNGKFGETGFKVQNQFVSTWKLVYDYELSQYSLESKKPSQPITALDTLIIIICSRHSLLYLFSENNLFLTQTQLLLLDWWPISFAHQRSMLLMSLGYLFICSSLTAACLDLLLSLLSRHEQEAETSKNSPPSAKPPD